MRSIRFFLLILFLFSSIALAEQNKPLQCFVTVNKASDWNNFDLHIDMYSMSETATRKLIMSFDMPKTSAALRLVKPFDCQIYQRFIFTAIFTPAIWHDAAGKAIGNSSDSKGIFDISSQVAHPLENQKNLIITVDFPRDFNINENPNLLIQPKSKS